MANLKPYARPTTLHGGLLGADLTLNISNDIIHNIQANIAPTSTVSVSQKSVSSYAQRSSHPSISFACL